MTFRGLGAIGTASAAVVALIGLSGCSTAPVFKNCTAMHRQYPHGVGRLGAVDQVRGPTKPVTHFYRSNDIYAANAKSDADHDGVACEAH